MIVNRCRVFVQSALMALVVMTWPDVGLADQAQAGYVLVTENGTNTVAKIDWTTDQVLGRMNVLAAPAAMAVDRARRWAYVSVHTNSAIAVLAPDSMMVTNMIVDGLGQNQAGIALTRDCQSLLVTTRGNDGVPSGDDTLDVIGLNTTSWPPTGTLVTNILTGTNPINVVVGHTGRRAVVSARDEPGILIIDLQAYQIVARHQTLPPQAEPEGSDIHPATNIVYVTLHGPVSAIEIVNLDTTSFVKRVGISHVPTARPSTGVFTPDGERFYVSSQNTDKVLCFDCSDPENPVQDMSVALPVGLQPHFIAFLPGGNKAYVADTGVRGTSQNGDLSVINSYTGIPSVSGQVLTDLVNPLRLTYMLPVPRISDMRAVGTNVDVTAGAGPGISYRLWSLDGDIVNNTNWQVVGEWLSSASTNLVFSDTGQNGRLPPAGVTNRFYRVGVFWRP
jgi:DNA-binding beta-propeller fold protein YncE